MPQCYWSLCTCPDTQPCPEHTGLACSVINGQTVTKPEDVTDAAAHAADLALIRMDADSTRLNDLQTRLRARLADIEREKREIESAASSARGYSQRNAVIDRADRLNAGLVHIDDEMQQIIDDLDVLDRTWQWQVNAVSILVARPYTDHTGYCACYTTKLQRLAQIDALIVAEQASLAQLMGTMNWWRTQLTPSITQFRALNVGGTILGSIVAALTLGAWLWLGTAAAAATGLLIGLAIVAIAVVALAIHIAVLRADILASRRRLLTLFLLYYRIQRIPTCQRAPLTTGGDSWWEWLLDQLKDVPGLPPPPPAPHEPAH